VKRLFFPAALALAIHGLIFCLNGELLKNSPYIQAFPPYITISLSSLPFAATSSDSQQLHVQQKKTGDMPENQSSNNKIVTDHKVVKSEPMGGFIPTDIPTPSGVPEANVLTESFTSPSAIKGYPEDRSEKIRQAYDHTAGEMSPVAQVLKEAVPLYKKNPVPVYPLQAKKRGCGGTVVLEVLVTKEGKAGKVSVFQSSRYFLLDEAAVSSVKKWRFEPGTIGDKKVDMPVKVPIRFQLETD